MLTEAEPPEALRMLRAGDVDVALVFRHYQRDADPGPPSAADEGTRGRLLLDEQVFLLTAAEGPAGAPDLAGAQGLAACAECRWIAGCADCRGSLLRQCAAAGFTPKITCSTEDGAAVQALVAAGLAVAMLPGLALRAARHPGIRATVLPGAGRKVFAVTYGDPPDPPASVRLIDLLAQAAGTDGLAARTDGLAPS